MTPIWSWVAWNADRSRICDAGVAYGHEAEAKRNAFVTMGGPHQADVAFLDLKLIAFGKPMDGARVEVSVDIRPSGAVSR